MRAAGLDFERRALVAREMPEPAIVSGRDVMFRVHEVGVCGTDRELSRFSFGYPPPGESFLVIGHEALGRVEEAGRDVSGLRPGDWVVPAVRRACDPPCESCARGRRDLCLSGRFLERGIFGMHGYFADYAVDTETDLVRVPPDLVDLAVLIEPLSVVEKAVGRSLRSHEGSPRTALVLGAGPIGILAALALQARGLEVSLYSLEPPEHPRARLAADAGARYSTALETEADIIVEATGSAEAALAAIPKLAPLGVMAILGAGNAAGEIPFGGLLENNQAVFGSVNASPESFALALADLGRFERTILRRMIRRVRFEAFRETIPDPAPEALKTVHVL